MLIPQELQLSQSHFTLNYAAHVNQDVNRKSIYVSCFSWNPL